MCNRSSWQSGVPSMVCMMPRCVDNATSTNGTPGGGDSDDLVGPSGAIDSSGQQAVKSDKLASWGPDLASTHSVAACISRAQAARGTARLGKKHLRVHVDEAQEGEGGHREDDRSLIPHFAAGP